MSLLFFFCFSNAATWFSSRIMPSCSTLADNAFRRFWKVSISCRSQMERTPPGEIRIPFLRSSLDTRTCPNAGLSIAICTTACSMCSSTRFFMTGLRREISCKATSPPCSYGNIFLWSLDVIRYASE